MDTITSDSGVKYDIVEEMGSRGSFGMHPTGRVYIQKSSQSIGECDHSFDSSLLSNPPIAVCSKCGFQKKESATCKSCLGKKKLSVYTNQVVSPDFIGDKPYHTGEDDIQYVNCSRCKGDGLEPKVESEKKDFGMIDNIIDGIRNDIKDHGFRRNNLRDIVKSFLSSNGYL